MNTPTDEQGPRTIAFNAARVWDLLPGELRRRLARLVDDPPRAAQLVSLLDNMAATLNEIERNAARADAGGELLYEDDDEERDA